MSGQVYGDPLVSHDQAAEYIGTTRQGLYAMIHKGEGPPHYKIGRRTRFRMSEVDAWLAERRVGAKEPA